MSIKIVWRNVVWVLTSTMVACGSPASPTRVQSPQQSAVPASASAAGTASIASFSVVEFQYPSAPSRWFYAPQIRVAAGATAFTVTRLDFTIPGLLPAPSPCGSWRVEPGQSLDLFREIYGDYEFTIDGPGVRSTGGTATVTATVRYDGGTSATLAASGPVVSGALPTTYTGGTGGSWGVCR